jgi:asparagine N-glycosylation enzyme membrane subunit Stt3
MSDLGFNTFLGACIIVPGISAFFITRRLNIYIRVLIAVVASIIAMFVMGELLVDRIPKQSKSNAAKMN